MKSKIRFGFFFDFRNPPQWHRPWADFYAEALEFITWMEDVGFDGAWVAEHHGAEDGYVPSPLVIAAAIAARTRKLRIGTSLAVAPFYHPVRFAEDCAVIDILSNGRLELALGVGWRPSEFVAYGASTAARGSYTDEFIQIIKRLWQGETVSFHSRNFNIDGALVMPQPVQKAIPLYVGGFSPKALRRAARYADGYQGFMECYPLYRDEVSACGKDPASAKLSLMDAAFYVSRDPEKTFEEFAPHVLHANNAYGQWDLDAEYKADAREAKYTPMDMATFRTSGLLKILTPEQAIAHIEAQLAAAPVDSFMTVAPPAGLPFSKFAECAELFAKEVIPAFR